MSSVLTMPRINFCWPYVCFCRGATLGRGSDWSVTQSVDQNLKSVPPCCWSSLCPTCSPFDSECSKHDFRGILGLSKSSLSTSYWEFVVIIIYLPLLTITREKNNKSKYYNDKAWRPQETTRLPGENNISIVIHREANYLSLCLIAQLKIYHLSWSVRRTRVTYESSYDLAPHGVLCSSGVKRRSAESEGLGSDFSWEGLRIFLCLTLLLGR